MRLDQTLGNAAWLRRHEAAVKHLLPPTWTHVDQVNWLEMGFGLKLLGVDWRHEGTFSQVLARLEQLGLLQRDGLTIRRNPNSIPRPVRFLDFFA